MVYVVIPVFNRLKFTLQCIADLKAQSYAALKIIVSDGGSTDGTVQTVRQQHADVEVLSSGRELWWTGAVAQGIDYALRESTGQSGFVLLMNNDTLVPPDYVEVLVDYSRRFDAAVGALIVDSKDPSHVLDAGEYIDWENYNFPVKTVVGSDEKYCSDVDVLPGRGTLVPIEMIRRCGNVDEAMLPHYLADYEFFYRLKSMGCRLIVSYETYVMAHIEETGILPSRGVSTLRKVWDELFSRRSMSNVVDHWRFISRHAPPKWRLTLLLRQVRRVVFDLTMRTRLRVLVLPFYRIAQMGIGQARGLMLFLTLWADQGNDILCYPFKIPKLIRAPLYFVASPGPISLADCQRFGCDPARLVDCNVLRELSVPGWFAFNTYQVKRVGQGDTRSLLTFACAIFPKIKNTLALKKIVTARGQQ